MTTIRLKFRPSTVTGHPGTIYYQLCHKQMTKRINTRIRIFPHQWDPETGHILSGTPENRVLEEVRRKIYRDMRMLENIASGMEASGKEFSLNELAERFKSVHSDVHTRSYVEEDIASLTCNMKLGTANNRRKALSSFLSFLGHKDIPLTEWSGSLFSEYAAWLSRRKVAPNTVSFYMRTLRSVYNKAVREGLVEQNHPFRNVYTGIDKTRKRAVSENIVLRMMQLDLSRSRPLELTRDLFVFSYCTRGMAFVDIAMLRHMDIRGDCILYARKKTGQIMRVRIEPCTKSILDKYSRLHPDSPYVFPPHQVRRQQGYLQTVPDRPRILQPQTETPWPHARARHSPHLLYGPPHLGHIRPGPQHTHRRHQLRHGAHFRTHHTDLPGRHQRLDNRPVQPSHTRPAQQGGKEYVRTHFARNFR